MPSWELLCLSCGRLERSEMEGDCIERSAIQHKRAYPLHVCFVASEIESGELISDAAL